MPKSLTSKAKRSRWMYKIIFFLSVYLPVGFLALVPSKYKIFLITLIVLSVVFNSITLLGIYLITTNSSRQTRQIKKAKVSKEAISGFLVSIMIPILSSTNEPKSYYFLLVAVFIIIFLITDEVDLLSFNIFLILSGYRTYKIELDDWEGTILCKGFLRSNAEITYVDCTNDLRIQIKG
jgi:hypothetical protein